MPKIITPGDEPAKTPKQQAHAIRPHEMPECAANPQEPCKTATTDLMIKGYDDKHRCRTCNDLHVELVMQEAGDSAPGSQPRFVAAKLDRRAEDERLARIQSLNQKLAKGSGIVHKSGEGVDGQSRGPRDIQLNDLNLRPLGPNDAPDMKSAMAKDEHGTRELGISDEERRRRILAKYGKRR